MSTLSRRQTRHRTFGPDAGDPARHNREAHRFKLMKKAPVALVAEMFQELVRTMTHAAHEIRNANFRALQLETIRQDARNTAQILGLPADDAEETIDHYLEHTTEPSSAELNWAITTQAHTYALTRPTFDTESDLY